MDALRDYFRRLQLTLIGEPAVRFIDPVVFSICLPLWDTDGDGMISVSEATAIRSFEKDIFNGKSDIISLDDLDKLGGYKFVGGFTNMPNLITASTGYRANGPHSTVSYSGSNSLKRIIMHPAIENIYVRSFYQCVSLCEIIWGGNEISIGNNAFDGCINLRVVNLPPKIENIGYSAFSRTALERLVIPSKVSTVDCIGYCDNLGFVEILGKTVTSIGGFERCPNLSTFIIHSEIPPSTKTNFLINSLPYIYVPDSSVNAYKNNIDWSTWASRIKPMSGKPEW